MKALVISRTEPPSSAGPVTGVHKRLRVFMAALDGICTDIQILHFTPPAIDAEGGVSRSDTGGDGVWGSRTRIATLPQAQRRDTFASHYLSGIVSAAGRQAYFRYCGEEQIRIVSDYLRSGPDLVFVHRFPSMLALLGTGHRHGRVFFDLDDVEHAVALRQMLAPPLRPGKIANLAHIPAIVLAEWRAAALARRTFVCSRADQTRLRRLGFPRVMVVPNAVHIPAVPPPLPRDPTILFLGLCSYKPNADAAERLVNRIFPLIRQSVPTARLLIAGPDSLDLPSARTPCAGVEYLGYVDDLDALYARSRAICCPMTVGGGTRIKLIEAAGYARPIVATRIGAEGLDFADDREVVLREDDRGIAQACADVLCNEERAASLGRAARQVATATYDFDAVRARVAELFAIGVAQTAKHAVPAARPIITGSGPGGSAQ